MSQSNATTTRAGVLTVALWLGSVAVATAASPPKPGYDDEGHLRRPVGYREWVYIGTPLTPNDMNPPQAAFPEFHNVYIHPDDWKHWSQTGTFQDGTVIVKELVTVGSKQAVSGNGYFMGDFAGLEATVKDSKRFRDEPGHWAYFSFGHSLPYADTAAAFPTASCNACHAASAADDFVFTQYYPVLRAARPERSGKSMAPGNREFDGINDAMGGALGAAHQPSAPRSSFRGEIPTDARKLLEYLRKGKYERLPARESAQHRGRGPHTRVGLPVRVYMNSLLDESLERGSGQHPPGSAAVKEMFDDSGRLAGWAVMVKTHENSDGGKGWYWYEVTSTAPRSRPVADGNGIPLCMGCHSIGQDFILTTHPLE